MILGYPLKRLKVPPSATTELYVLAVQMAARSATHRIPGDSRGFHAMGIGMGMGWFSMSIDMNSPWMKEPIPIHNNSIPMSIPSIIIVSIEMGMGNGEWLSHYFY